MASALIVAGVVLFLFFSNSSIRDRQPGDTRAPAGRQHEVSGAQGESGAAGLQPADRRSKPVEGATAQAPSIAGASVPSAQLGKTDEIPAPDLVVSTNEVVDGKGVFTEPYIKRTRLIAINPKMLEKEAKLTPGSRLNINLFPDAKYTVTLQLVNRGPQGDLSVSGKLAGEEYGTFVLSSASGVVVGKLADPTARRLFLIRCHGQDKTHYAVEVDLEKTPVPGKTSSDTVIKKN